MTIELTNFLIKLEFGKRIECVKINIHIFDKLSIVKVGKMDSIGDKDIDVELNKLIELLEQNEVIQQYKKIDQRVKNNEKLTQLIEEIKKAQKDAVQFAHYEKPLAEQEALKRADELTAQFDEHPLVIAYREQLKEANDLLQHITSMIQREVNDQLEKEG